MTLAFVFPGHGSQMVGMLDSISNRPEVKKTLQEASDILSTDMEKLIANGPKESFSALSKASPITLIAAVSFYKTWLSEGGPAPDIVAGHSHGEYSALVAAGVISFKDAISILRYRAESMQAINGGMASINGIGAAKVVEICANLRAESGKIVEVANFNAPGRLLISGDKDLVLSACKLFDTAGATVFPLKITVPAHSSLLNPVSEKLQEYLQQIVFHTPRIPIINNVDVTILTEPADIKNAMQRQVAMPVRWQEIIKKMESIGIKQVVECGPGNVLNTLTPKISSSLQGFSFADQRSLFEILHIVNN